MKLLPIALALIVSSRALAQNAAEQPGQSPRLTSETCTVQGMVVSAATAEPLKGARVVLIDRDQTEHPEGLTDSAGHFIISGVPAGTYHFRASKVGYVEQAYHTDASGPARLLTLAPGEEVNKVLFRLSRAAVIMGRITDETGEPVVGVLVAALVSKSVVPEEWPPSVSGLTPFQFALTNDLGEYRLYNLPPGSYYVAASDARLRLGLLGGERPPRGLALAGGGLGIESHDHPLVYYPGVPTPRDAQKVSVSAGQERRIDLSLRPVKMLTLSGRVLDPNGHPVAQARVGLRSQSDAQGTFHEKLENSTDTQGNFEIKKVLPGSYVISADAMVQGSPHSTEQQVEVAGDDVAGLQLRLTGALEISGRLNAVGEAPLDFSVVEVVLSNESDFSSGRSSAWANKDGAFTVATLSQTTHRLRLWGLPPGWYVRSAVLGSRNVLEDGLRLDGENTAHLLEITVSSAVGRVDGVVLKGDAPVAGARVKLLRDPVNPFRDDMSFDAWADRNGHFVIANVFPGNYRAVAFDVEGEQNESDDDSPAGVSIAVAEKESKTVQIKLPSTRE